MSQSDWKNKIEKIALDILWSHWIKLGAYVDGKPCCASTDPETLILFTCLMAPKDRRLVEIMKQWLMHYEALVNVERLKTIFKLLITNQSLSYDVTNLQQILLEVLPTSSIKRWEKFFSLLRNEASSIPLSSDSSKKSADEKSRKKLHNHNQILEENSLLQFRYAFGVTAKADILYFLSIYSHQPDVSFQPPATGRNIALTLHYNPATILRTLKELEDGQLILSKEISANKIYFLNAQAPLLRWLPKSDRFFLHWFTFFDIFLGVVTLDIDVCNRHETIALNALNIRLKALDSILLCVPRIHRQKYAKENLFGLNLETMWSLYQQALEEVYHALIEPRRLNWMSDELTRFLDTAQHNLYASYTYLNEFQTIIEVDQIFQEVIPHLSNQKNWFESLFFTRSHSSFRAATRLAGSGELREAFSLMRNALEDALDAFRIYQNPELIEIWLNRENSKESKKSHRNKFQYSKVIHTYEKKDQYNGPIVKKLYDLAIDYGAHPNVYAYLSNLEMKEEDKIRTILTLQLNTNELPLKHAMKSVARTGLCCLFIFENIFGDRFKAAGISEKLRTQAIGL